MRLLVAGTPDVAIPALDALHASEHEVVAVLTRPDARTGRGRRLSPSPLAMRAEQLGIEVLKPTRPGDPEFVEQLRGLEVDCAPVVAYGALIPQPVLEIPRLGWINLHFSLLPRWRGAAPVQRAIMAGDAVTGACVFQLVRELDAGDVFTELRTEIGVGETAGVLLERLAHSGAGLLTQVVDELASGTASATPQPSTGITVAPKLEVAEARVDWSDDLATIDRQIRGCTPAPGAWSLFRGERFKILAAEPASDTTEGAPAITPGTILAERKQVLIGTGSVPLRLLQVQPFGKKPMAAGDWARGAQLQADERLGD